MSISPRRDNFTGCNNLNKAERLPEGAVVDSVNLDFTRGGKAELRAGFTELRTGADIRAIFSSRDGSLVVAEGQDLIRILPLPETFLAKIPPGPIAGTLFNNKLYVSTSSVMIEVGDTVSDWVTLPPVLDVSMSTGSLGAGVYKVAVTAIDSSGKESGCVPYTIGVSDGQALNVSFIPESGVRYSVYASAQNGEALYLQGESTGAFSIPSVSTDGRRLTTGMLGPFPNCEVLSSFGGRILGAAGKTLYFSSPMQPHLYDPEAGFLLFASNIDLIAPVEEGVFVCADRTFFITGIGTPEMEQREVLSFGGVAGTVVHLPDGSAAWFSEYGQIISSPLGEVEQMNKESYSPSTAKNGASGVLEFNGNRIIATTMRGDVNPSRLSSTDSWVLEVS